MTLLILRSQKIGRRIASFTVKTVVTVIVWSHRSIVIYTTYDLLIECHKNFFFFLYSYVKIQPCFPVEEQNMMCALIGLTNQF